MKLADVVKKKMSEETDSRYTYVVKKDIDKSKLNQIYSLYGKIIEELFKSGYSAFEIKTTLLKDLDDQIANMT